MTGLPPIRLIRAANPSPLTGTGTNTWLVGGSDLVVIDPGPDLPDHLAAILAAIGPGQRIARIVVTHAHLDHSALAPRLSAATGAPVHAFGTATDGRGPLMQALAPSLPPHGEGLDLTFSPDLRLEDGTTLSGPDYDLTALHTPGHLGGHLAFALGDLLFSGDHVMGWSTSIVSPDGPDGDMVEGLPDPPWPRSVSIPVLTARVYVDTPRHLLPAAERNVFAHLVDLHSRGLVTATPALHPDAGYALA
jgi:glyoxylase-like metal-dependent hydrolase (beta-lactamase superfamily II)